MLISYKAVYHLIDRFYARKSLQGIIDDCKDYFDEAIDKAKELEDYAFLETLINQKDSLNEEFVVFFNYKNRLPTVLNKDEDLSLEAFAYLCVDCTDIPFTEFRDIVHAQAANNGLIPNELTEEFEYFVKYIKNYYRLGGDKIGRNEPCPCGSGKKFKNCHELIMKK
jgi:hypothetical protein